MSEYWSWWQGGLALGLFTVLFRVLLSRPVGVSGSWFRVTTSREERQAEQEAAQLAGDSEAMNDAFMAATLEAFGSDQLPGTEHGTTQAATGKENKFTPASVGQHGVFLLFIFIGGFLSALYSGRFSVDFELSSRFTQLSHGMASSWVYLLLGGVMVGFGTQMAGGCTTGHGLSGCAQLSGSSLLATAVFFVCAVIAAVIFVATVPL